MQHDLCCVISIQQQGQGQGTGWVCSMISDVSSSYSNRDSGRSVRAGVDRSRPFWPESEPELESVKFCKLRLRPGVVGCYLSTDDNFGRATSRNASSRCISGRCSMHFDAMHRVENIDRSGGKRSGSMKIRLERDLAIEFGLKKVSG